MLFSCPDGPHGPALGPSCASADWQVAAQGDAWLVIALPSGAFSACHCFAVTPAGQSGTAGPPVRVLLTLISVQAWLASSWAGL